MNEPAIKEELKKMLYAQWRYPRVRPKYSHSRWERVTPCPNCDGNRYVEYGEECSQCGGTGTADPTDEELDEWLEEAQGAIIDALSNCPL